MRRGEVRVNYRYREDAQEEAPDELWQAFLEEWDGTEWRSTDHMDGVGPTRAAALLDLEGELRGRGAHIAAAAAMPAYNPMSDPVAQAHNARVARSRTAGRPGG